MGEAADSAGRNPRDPMQASSPRGTTLRSRLMPAVALGVLLPGLLGLALAAIFGGLGDSRWQLGGLLVVVAQAALACGLILRRLAAGLEVPLLRLEEQAHRLTSARAAAPLGWPREDDFAPLARELELLRQHIGDLHGELRSTESRLHKASTADALTGLPNRAVLRELFVREAAAARRQSRSLALLHLGLDRFRSFNDTLGHAVGDELLIGMGQRIAATLRDADFVCRAGGDEFLILLPGTDDWDRVARAAERLLGAVERPLRLPGSSRDATLSASIGVALYPSDGTDFEALDRAAALAMARSKALGRGLYSFYQPSLDAALRQRIEAERELALALEREEFTLFYQPLVDAASGAWIGCEALLRWQHPARGLLSPAAFIDDARRCGLIRDIDAWVLDHACADLARWREAKLPDLRMSINLSVQQARNPALAELLRSALERHGLSPGQLELEITEDVLTQDPEGVLKALARWRALGLTVAVDDFGVGYSSLSQLRALRPQRLKLDCSLVAGLPDDAGDRALAEAMLGMARALGIEVVAEGVEIEAQRAWLLAQGCSVQQGHVFAQPMGRHEFEQRLKATQLKG